MNEFFFFGLGEYLEGRFTDQCGAIDDIDMTCGLFFYTKKEKKKKKERQPFDLARTLTLMTVGIGRLLEKLQPTRTL